MTKLHQVNEEAFNELFLVALDETLASLGESARTAIYFHIEKRFNLKKTDIPNNISEFTEALDKLFGIGSKPLQAMILRTITSKINVDLPEKSKQIDFQTCICKAKEKILSDKEVVEHIAQLSQKPNSHVSAEDSFEAVINLIVDPTVILDMDGKIVFMNTAYANAIGCGSSRLIGASFLQLPNLSQESKTVLSENLKKINTYQIVEPFEVDFTGPDGTRKFEVNTKKVQYKGQPADIVICRDIMGQKQCETQLQEYNKKLSYLVDVKTSESKASQQKFEAIFYSSPDAIMVTDENATIVECNPATVRLFGYTSKNEVLGKNAFVLSALEAESTLTFMQSLLKQGHGTARNISYAFTNNKGVLVAGEFSVSTIKSASEQNAHFVIVVKNDPERKKAEENLLASEKKYRSLCHDLKQTETHLLQEKDTAQNYLDAADVILVALDSSGAIKLFNRKGAEVLGYNLEEVQGKNWFDTFVPEEVRAERKRVHKLRIQEGSDKPEYCENEILCNKGKRCIIAWRHTIVKDRTGKIVGSLSSGEDITEQRTMRQALVESERMFRSIVENSTDSIILSTAEGRICYTSPSCQGIVGYTSEELHKKLVSDIIHPADQPRVARAFKKAADGKKGSFEYRVIAKDGQERWVAHSWSPVVENGKIDVIVSIVRDITERKQLADELRASEERFRAISNCAMDAIILVDDKHRVMYWNPAAEKIFGYTQAEAVGIDLAKLVVPRLSNSRYLTLISQCFAESLPERHFEFTAKRKDGSTLPVELSFGSVKLGNSKCVLGIVRDISIRKEMEAELKRERDMLEEITKNIGAGLSIISKDYRILWINKYLKKLYGNVLNEQCYSIFDGIEQVCPDCGAKKIFEGANYDSREYFNKENYAKGQPSWFEVIATPIRDKDGNVTAALELTVDITEKKMLQAKLLEERNKLEAITENINAGLVLINRNHDIIWINKFAKQSYGEAINKKCYKAIHRRNKICDYCSAEKVFNGSEIEVRDTIIERNGEKRWMEITATPMKDQEGNIKGVLELAVDVTETKQLQDKLDVYSRKLEELVEQRTAQLKQTQARLVKSERLAAIGELAGMVGHDLRNPLTSIKGAAYYLKTKYANNLEEAGKEMLLTIDRSIDYSNKIINDLLDFSREITLDWSQTTPSALVKEALQLIAVPEDVKLTNLVADSPLVTVDTTKISRVIVNLVRNALDAMPKGGGLMITSSQAEDYWELTFKDTGMGMTEETINKLWTPLFTTKAKGMGFGLAICKRIVESHGGKITVKSAVGKGTEFIIKLPIKAQLNSGNTEFMVPSLDDLKEPVTKK